MTSQNLRCSYLRLHLCILKRFVWSLDFGEFNHEIATHLSDARNDRRRGLRMTKWERPAMT